MVNRWKFECLASQEQREDAIRQCEDEAWKAHAAISAGKYWLAKLDAETMEGGDVHIVGAMAIAEQLGRLAAAQERTADAQERVAKAMEDLAVQIGSEYISVLVTQA